MRISTMDTSSPRSKVDMPAVYLAGVGSFIPENLYTNRDICEAVGLSPRKGEKYEALLGVRSRPICVDYRAGGKQIVTGEELALRAAYQALHSAGITAAALDAVICTSSFFDYVAPPLSSRLLKRLEITSAMTFDLMGGCAEFLHGIQVAANMIRLGQADTVLITASEVINAFWRQVRYPIEYFIFGDTGGAIVLSSRIQGSHRLISEYLSTHSQIAGEPAELICVPIIGGKEPAPLFYTNTHVDRDAPVQDEIPAHLRLVHDIKKVASGAPQAMIEATRRILHEQSVSPDSVYLVPHQASIGVLSALPETGVPVGQIGISLPERGNMSTASLPVTLCEHLEEALSTPYLVLTSVGVGMSFGATLFERVKREEEGTRVGERVERPEIGR